MNSTPEPKPAAPTGVGSPNSPAGDKKLSPETDEVAAIRDYWFAAKKLYKRDDYPDYGTDEWMELPIEDPRKLAGLVAYAQLWRKYGEDVEHYRNRIIRYREPLWSRPTLAQLNEAGKPGPAHQLKATPSWPPIRVPGTTGSYLNCTKKEAA